MKRSLGVSADRTDGIAALRVWLRRVASMPKPMRRKLLLLVGGMFLVAPSAFAQNPLPHAPILITNDKDFLGCSCVVAGTGTALDPFQIGPWKIDDLSQGFAVKIDNTKGKITQFFTLVGITSNPPVGAVDPGSPVVWLSHVTQDTLVQNTTANAAGTGVYLVQSRHVRIDGSSLNKMLGSGHVVVGSSNIVVTNSKLKSEQSGMVLKDSAYVSVGGDPACAQAPDCNDFTYDEAYGLLILNSHDVLVEGLNATANDTAGILLNGKGTYRVEVRASRASGNGPICHTMQPSGLREHTGLEVDHNGGIVLINGAHDNFIHDNTANGDAGFDLRSGGDGLFVDPCTGAVVPVATSAPMGANNRFAPGANCYSTTNINPPPPKATNCPGS